MRDWEDRARDLLERFDLAVAADRVTCGLLATAWAAGCRSCSPPSTRPRLLLLDEPFDGVDPLGVDATLEVVREVRATGAAVLVSTHLLHLAVEACEEAVVLRGGRVVGAAPAAELTGDAGRDRYRALIA